LKACVNDFVLLLPHVNAALNGLAGLLLVVGYVLIKQRREIAHRNAMLAAFGTSVVFLGCYLTYHYFAGSKHFPRHYGDAIRYAYLAMLASHVVLAAAVPFLAVWTIYLGYANQRARHRYWAWYTFPIWLYVSVTGIAVYAMLYHLFPATSLGQ
jgi:putative membrane protein